MADKKLELIGTRIDNFNGFIFDFLVLTLVFEVKKVNDKGLFFIGLVNLVCSFKGLGNKARVVRLISYMEVQI